ncbi:MAG: DeoR/GlpR family DNA-binding transcription regulator [Eubacteriaceae bacterium]|jgi:DeoR family fructose operon transcriptional repressor
MKKTRMDFQRRNEALLKEERHAVILELIHQKQNVQVKELQDQFHVSDETVRRDLIALEKQGLLRCVHGGAVYDRPTAREYHVDLRIKQNQLEKEAICQTAATLVKDGQSVAIAASTTTLPLGTLLVLKNNLTVVTNSIYLANQIAENKSNTVCLIGGRLWVREQKNMGSLAANMFRQFRVDKAFFSVAGVSPHQGIMEYTEAEMELTRAVMESARERILLTDASKYEAMAFYKIDDIKAISQIVTDWHIGQKEMLPYEKLGIVTHRAEHRK